MAAAIGVIGLVGDGLGIYSFLSGLFAGKGDSQTTVIRVAAALNGNGLESADGDIAAIRTYNSNEQLLGSRSGDYIGSGDFKDFEIGQTNVQQAPYVQIGASDNAICIPYVTTTWVDGSQYGWTGDWGYLCGLDWYYSTVYVNSSKDQTRCTWIDNDHTNGFKAGMLFIHFPSFTDQFIEGNDVANYCKYPALRAYTQDTNGGQIFKRDGIEGPVEEVAQKKKRALDSRIVITSAPSHNATKLCESETSRGPDLVSLHEKVYCNMETRHTLPLCADDIVTDCFDVESKQERKQNGRRSPKEFTDVINWE